ncbi:tellurite resistance TerB family protein [Adhaeribacter radiodurans]|uniref:TerB family tellurite resistance protein n=1 Tax=Adhaeribacter radiodurans TaxID=2745197 RepID=A0A7L7LB07_9BACT|nr:TerB family tellurite resistance protein [Adhaeribacter radiodurans]QMU29735.1 TerB family tellurite resistance protein [Adhaeribacter radiodurans]
MFNFFESEQLKRIKSHILNLGALAKIDGHVDSAEMNYIITIGTKNGLKQEEVRSLLANAQTAKFELPANDSERFDQIYDLVEMMLADGIVDDNEMDFCVEMAAKLGFKKSIVGVLVRKISMGVKDGQSREEIKQDSQSFLEL